MHLLQICAARTPETSKASKAGKAARPTLSLQSVAYTYTMPIRRDVKMMLEAPEVFAVFKADAAIKAHLRTAMSKYNKAHAEQCLQDILRFLTKCNAGIVCDNAEEVD